MPYINVDEAYILDNTGLQVDMATDIPFADAGFTDAQKAQARKNIAAGGSNPNLLDNAYFVGGGSQLGDGVFPINQRGQSTYTGGGTQLDRWKTWDGSDTMVLTANGLQYTSPASSGMFQYFPVDLPTSTMTFSVKVSGTIYSVTIAEGTSEARTNIPGGEILVNRPYKTAGIISHNTPLLLQAAKLEIGTVSTLANDPPPDFGEELRKCQRYLFIYRDGYLGWFYGNGSTMYGIINTPVPLRATPTVSFTSNGFVSVATGAYVTSAGSFAVDIVNGTTLRMYAALGGAVANGMYLLYLDSGQTLTLSAEL